MPKKRNTSWSRNKKEDDGQKCKPGTLSNSNQFYMNRKKQIITARLIEISVKVDDYIYKHKLISVCEAEQYMKEVCYYKTQCNQDEPSLQVIEKLTRCMKAIMFDHKELRPNIHGENNGSSIADVGGRAGSISPVYSIADEDRTQLTQIAEARPVDVMVANKDVEIIDLSNIDDDDDLIHNDTNTTTADYADSKIPVEVDIHRGMSSLSLRDVGAAHMIASDVICSQSILNNFEGVDQMQQNEINIVSEGAVAGELVSNVDDEGKTINVIQAVSNTTLGKISNERTTPIIEPNKTMNTSITPNKPVILRNTNSNLIQKTDVQNKEYTIDTANYSLTITSNQNDNTSIISSLLSVYPITNNIPETQRQTWYDSNRTCTINDSSHTLKDANHFTQSAQIYKVVNPVIVKNVDILNGNISANTFDAAEKENQPIKAAENPKALSNKTAIVQDDSTTIKNPRALSNKIAIVQDDSTIIKNPRALSNKTAIVQDDSTTIKNPRALGNKTAIVQDDYTSIKNPRALSNKTAIVQDNSTTIRKQRGRKKKALDEKEIKPKKKRVYQPLKSNKENTFTESAKNKIIPLYNENVINDLSWIENIRYVREIKVDENDPKLNLEESFWDNYYLPTNWSENEFV